MPIILLILIILLIIASAKNYSLISINQRDNKVNIKVKEPEYVLKKALMNTSEKSFYNLLENSFRDKYLIFCKVRIEDFVKVLDNNIKTQQELFGLRNKIKSRHVDFLVCDFQTTRPLLAIELDGFSHNYLNKIERDNFINELYNSIGLEIIHVKVGSIFSEVVQNIGFRLQNQYISSIL